MTVGADAAVYHKPWRALAAAIILQAVRDAREGDRAAALWLERDPWADALCGYVFGGAVGPRELLAAAAEYAGRGRRG
jgi:hypothetical protein